MPDAATPPMPHGHHATKPHAGHRPPPRHPPATRRIRERGGAATGTPPDLGGEGPPPDLGKEWRGWRRGEGEAAAAGGRRGGRAAGSGREGRGRRLGEGEGACGRGAGEKGRGRRPGEGGVVGPPDPAGRGGSAGGEMGRGRADMTRRRGGGVWTRRGEKGWGPCG
ncbi:uncharacterized protein [Miscanthus floridulus]|uniref:uncharacterized protein n=1 Tax=Miscanthus floridulus TaxID=154761 RepID=UPI00345AB38F